MFGSALIVFRESLEAALLIGIIAATTRDLAHRDRWLGIGVAAGIIGSLVVAALTESIAQLAGGSGQELFNASVLGVAVLMIGWHNIWMASHGKELSDKAKQVGGAIRNGQQELSAIAIAIAFTVFREGSETALFLHGMAASTPGSGGSVLLGGLTGLIAGCLLGVLIYIGLLRIPVRRFFSVTNALLLLLAAGLAAQVAKFLVQADWLPSLSTPLWNTSAFLPVESGLGTALHILIGYEAQPSGMQVVFYAATLASIFAGSSLVQRRSRSSTFKLATA
jgi:high-affinity iron transporter